MQVPFHFLLFSFSSSIAKVSPLVRSHAQVEVLLDEVGVVAVGLASTQANLVIICHPITRYL